MKSAFQQKLFRLFLIISILPVVVLTSVAYYLSSEFFSGNSTEIINSSPLLNYHRTDIYNRIEKALSDQQLLSSKNSLVDFAFIDTDSGTVILKNHTRLTPETVHSILTAVTSRPRGFVETDKLLFQYAVKHNKGNTNLIGGIIHNDEYSKMLSDLEQSLGTQSEVNKLRPKFLIFVFGLFVVIAGIAIIFSYLISRRFSSNISAPLNQLARASEEIAAGKFEQKVELSSEGELQTLIDSFNLMSLQLDSATRQLAQTERVAAWRQVARRFAHELKNPLQPLLVSLYRIEKELIDTEAYDKIYEPLKAASEEVRHLKLLAERFSHLSKLPEPTITEFDLTELIESITFLYEDRLLDRNFILMLPEAPLMIHSDHAYLREALHNLLQNSLDATGSGERIEIRLASRAGKHIIIVSDGGRGMNPDQVSQATLPYFTTKEKGTGLGLAIVEKSISELNGQVEVESTPGRGTNVSIILPGKLA